MSKTPDEFGKGRLPEAITAKGLAVRLAVRTDEPLRTVLAEGRLIAGSPDAVHKAIRLALPELPLSVVPAPRGLPASDGADAVEYLAPAPGHAAWKEALSVRCLALAYYPSRPSGAERLEAMVKLYILRGGTL